MEIELRPLNLGEILDRTFQLYRSRFLTFIGIASLGAGIDLFFRLIQVLGIRFLFASHIPVLVSSIITSLTGLVASTIFAVAIALVTAAINCAVILLYLGRVPGIAQSYAEVWPRWFRYIRLNVLVLLVCVAPGIVPFLAFIICAGLAKEMKPFLVAGLLGVSALLMMAAFPFCAWLALRYSLANAACTFENAGIRHSMKRSAFLSFGLRSKILVLLLLVVAMQMLISSIFVAPTIPFLIANHGILANHGQVSLGFSIYMLAVGFLNNLLIVPILGIGLMLFYFDARMRKEGFDVEWMLQRSIQAGIPQAGIPLSPAPETPFSGTPAPESGEPQSTGLGLV
jgi:hypothetical protein